MTYVLGLPETYVPFHILNVCSNNFIDVAIPIAVNEFPVLLVGRGEVPLVWLAAPRGAGSTDWMYVVTESQSNNPAVEVRTEKAKRQVAIELKGALLLKARCLTDDEAIVEKLDLRATGLAVTGHTSGLHIGSNSFSGNVIRSARIGIALA